MAQTGSSGVFKVGVLLMSNSVFVLTGAGTPTNGTSGTFAGRAGPGSLYLKTNGAVYANTNTKASPTWTLMIGPQAAVLLSPAVNGALFNEYAQDSITAGATQTQAGATQLVAQTSRVATVTTIGDGVKLPASAAGLELLVINHGANAMRMYGSGADTIDDQTNTVGVLQMPNSLVIYTCTTAGAWYTEGLATGFGGPGLQTLSFLNSITPLSGGGQAGATALTAMFNRVTGTIAQGDSVRLPVSAPGLQVIVDNQATQPIQVFGAGTDTINGIATATGFPQGVKSIVTYSCTVTGNWEVGSAGSLPVAISTLAVNGAIPATVPHNYAITKAGVLADTLAAPPASPGGDGIEITIASDTANAHTITFTGSTLDTGSAAALTATFNAFKGASLTVMSYNARWKVIAANGVSFS